MRKAGRIVFLLLFSYLAQATILPYFRINAIILDVVTVALYTSGFACGMYAGFATGLLGALLLEVLSGDLPGLSSLSAVVAGILGAYMAKWTGNYQKATNKRQERFVKRVAPSVALSAFVAAREIIFIMYFYLTGADILAMHFARMVRCALITGALGLLLIPAMAGFMTREKKKTFIAKWRRRRKNRKLPKRFGPVIELPKEDFLDFKTELSTQFPIEPQDLFEGISSFGGISAIETEDSEDAPKGETEAE